LTGPDKRLLIAFPMSNERRKHPRVNLEVDVDVSSGSNFYAGRTRDISMGGIFVEMPVTPEVGTEIGLKLQVGKRQFAVVARCAWILTGSGGAPIGFGAEFTTLVPGAKRAIEAFMAKRDPMAFDLLDDVEEEPEEPPAKKGPPPLPK
jgi:Tfp pilus assembly protein PilZ